MSRTRSGDDGGLPSCSVAEAALEAWVDCGPDGYAVSLEKLSPKLQAIAAKIPSRPVSEEAVDLGKLFAPPREGEPAIFLQMLRAQSGKVHFLYFWKAFGEVARIAGAVTLETDNLSAEMEMLRDRVLRLAEEAIAESSSDSASSTSGYAPKAPQLSSSARDGASSLSEQVLKTASFVDEVNRAASMSAYPQFWRAAASSLKSRKGMKQELLSLEYVTALLLSWLQDGARYEAEQRQKAEAVAKKEEKGLRVKLHVYDVSQEQSIQKINRVLAHKHSPLKLGGVFHAGVEVNGLEWSFGFSESETHPGVSCVEPRTHPQHHYRQTVDMGCTKVAAEDIADIITSLIEEYPGDDYELLRRNCCHFADDFTRRLGVGHIPGWVIRLARMGAGVDSLIQSAPRPIQKRLGYIDDDSDD
eukprot:TRINITY_DN35315_c0_g1_i1.p1 TRINITY_DN35315_c0_g1~~TRINITY_DN35315_c0_g1_i1.p1  ORF type:complete len:430 (+),score=101.67 TRINITY_DN35315_c0_g1_i1:47-1291(+)